MKTLIIGLDAFDPEFFERLNERGRMPNLDRFVQAGGYSRFGISNPPQSEVSWTSIATGLNPGGHGIFDFVHRVPATHDLYVSLLPTGRTVGGTKFVAPHHARTLFEEAVSQGYPATSLWWPATFPASLGSPVRQIPGLGTPDIHGRMGVGTIYAEIGDSEEAGKTRFSGLVAKGKRRYGGAISGPTRKKGRGAQEVELEFELDLDDSDGAVLRIAGRGIPLKLGEWSPIFELEFRMGRLFKFRALTRAILTRTAPDVRLYMLPLQLHPLHSPWPYAAPRKFVGETWNKCGPFLTLGWPQDTTGLEEGHISDDQFLRLCEEILDSRLQILMMHLERFEEGVLAAVFDSLDRVQHMFWRDRPDIVEQWYVRLDTMVGTVERMLREKIGKDSQLLIVSDHGFADFGQKVHVNRWLINQGYLQPLTETSEGNYADIDWPRTRAYAVGLNSLYLNLAGREGKGSLAPSESTALLEELKGGLASWRDPAGRPVLEEIWEGEAAFEGPLKDRAPDVVLGFARGFRASASTGLGGWKGESLEPNHDHWGADHCMHPGAVPGVIFALRGLDNSTDPSYEDFPRLAIGADLEQKEPPRAEGYGDEDIEVVEERLKSLGYF